jgi:hypothetical protein
LIFNNQAVPADPLGETLINQFALAVFDLNNQ